jgi:hypothetical protein
MNTPKLQSLRHGRRALPLAAMVLALLALQAFTIAHAWHHSVPGECPAQSSGHPLDCPFCVHHNLDGSAVQVAALRIPCTLQSSPLPPSPAPSEHRVAVSACARDPPLPL